MFSSNSKTHDVDHKTQGFLRSHATFTISLLLRKCDITLGLTKVSIGFCPMKIKLSCIRCEKIYWSSLGWAPFTNDSNEFCWRQEKTQKNAPRRH